MTESADAHDPMVAEADDEIHKQSGKLWYWLEPPMCVWTYMWLTGWLPNRGIQYLRPWLSGSLTGGYRIWSTCWKWYKHWGGKSYPSREDKADPLPLSPLPPPYTSWQVGRSFAVHGPLGSLSCCHEWMSLRCWTLGSAANSVPTICLFLVVQNGHADEESYKQLLILLPTQRHSCQSANTTHHCHCFLGVAVHGFHKHWDDYGVRQPLNVVSILVFCDHFMKHVMADVTHDQTAKTVAKFLWQGYMSILTAPAMLLSDWGANFKSNIIKELCELMDIQKVQT